VNTEQQTGIITGAQKWTGWGRIGRQIDRQRAGRQAERRTGWGRTGRQTNRQRQTEKQKGGQDLAE
jgi:hypothetical protein